MKKSQMLAVVLVISLTLLLGAGRGVAQGPGPTAPQAALGPGFTYTGRK